MRILGWLFLIAGVIASITIIGLFIGIPLIIVGVVMMIFGGRMRRGAVQKKIAKLEYKTKYGKIDPKKAEQKIDKLKIKKAKYS